MTCYSNLTNKKLFKPNGKTYRKKHKDIGAKIYSVADGNIRHQLFKSFTDFCDTRVEDES